MWGSRKPKINAIDEGQICRLPRVTENAATSEKKVESLYLCLAKKLPPEWVFQKFSRQQKSLPITVFLNPGVATYLCLQKHTFNYLVKQDWG